MNEDKLKRFLMSLLGDIYLRSPDFLKIKLKELDEVFISSTKQGCGFLFNEFTDNQFTCGINKLCENCMKSTKGDAYIKSNFMNDWANNKEDDKFVDALNGKSTKIERMELCVCGHKYKSHSHKDGECMYPGCDNCKEFKLSTNSAPDSSKSVTEDN